MRVVRSPIFSLWESCPALYYATAALCGIALFYGFYSPLLLFFTQPRYPQYWGFLLVATAMYGYCAYSSYRSVLPTEMTGVGYLQIVRIAKSPYHPQQKVYYGALSVFITKEGTFYHLPLSFVPAKALSLTANQDYTVQVTVSPSNSGTYRCKIHSCQPVKGTVSLAQWRFTTKQALKQWVKKQAPHTYCRALYNAFLTGESENTLLSFLFARVGLQHALAISGFHYACLIALLAYLLHYFFSRRVTASLLILFCTGYLVFMGNTPSLCRAYIALIVYLLGYVLLRNANALNSLGVALLLNLLIDPTLCRSIGFQLSYLATFALITLTHPLQQLLSSLCPKRPWSSVSQWPFIEQLAYLGLRLFIQLMSVNLAIYLCLTPLLLGHFQLVTLSGLLYNLCIPPLLTITLALLLLSILCFPLASYIFAINTIYTQWITHLLLYIPLPFNYSIPFRDMPTQTIVTWTLVCFLMGLFAYELKRIDEKKPI